MTKKEKLLCEVQCPWCNESLMVIKETEIIVPAEPAEKKEIFKTAKVAQTKLTEVKP